jgi:hypothetical protein
MFEKADHLMATYVDATEEFGRSANEFLQHATLLPKAWNAYQQAMTASAELRRVLDNKDDTLRTLMTQLEQAVSAPFGKPALVEKKPEATRASAASAGSMSAVKTLP